MRKRQRTAMLPYYVQTWWIDINIPSNDDKLQEKILFALEYNNYDTLYHNDTIGYGDTVVDIIPFPEYPGFQQAQSDLLDLNNAIETFKQRKRPGNHWFGITGTVRCNSSEEDITDKKTAILMALTNTLQGLESQGVISSSDPFFGSGWSINIFNIEENINNESKI